MPSALAGIRIIDLTSSIAGPYCTKLLADYGAEVIKIESPGQGDVARHMGPFPGNTPDPEQSATFLHLNTTKRAITLDIRREAGAALLRQLVQQADVIVDDGALATAAGEGWDYASLAQAKPSLILTVISPFGPDGPYHDYAASDIVMAAMSGWMYPMGDPDQPPLQPGIPSIAYVAGLWAAAGTLTALFSAMLSGEGQRVDVPVLEAAAATTVYDMVRHSYSGDVRTRHGHRFGLGSRGELSTSLQPCADGHFLLMGGPYRDRLPVLLDLPDLLDNERYTPDQAWVDHSEEVEARIQAAVADRTRDEIFHGGQALRMPLAPVASPSEILASAQLAARHYFTEVTHPVAGALRHTGTTYHMSGTPRTPIQPAPILGQDNAAIFGDLLKLDEAAITALRAQGII